MRATAVVLAFVALVACGAVASETVDCVHFQSASQDKPATYNCAIPANTTLESVSVTLNQNADFNRFLTGVEIPLNGGHFYYTIAGVCMNTTKVGGTAATLTFSPTATTPLPCPSTALATGTYAVAKHNVLGDNDTHELTLPALVSRIVDAKGKFNVKVVIQSASADISGMLGSVAVTYSNVSSLAVKDVENVRASAWAVVGVRAAVALAAVVTLLSVMS